MNEQSIVAKNDFVFKTLSDKANWTEAILTGLMEKAHIRRDEPTPEDWEKYKKMGIKFLWLLSHSEAVAHKFRRKPWIPTQSCVDLTTLGAALTSEEEQMSIGEVRELWATDALEVKKSRRAKRKFKHCLGCTKRFLAKRATNLTCSARCRQKALRNSRLSQIPANPALQPA